MFPPSPTGRTNRQRMSPGAALLGMALLGALGTPTPEQMLREKLLTLAQEIGALHGVPAGAKAAARSADPLESLEADVRASEERVNRVLRQVQAKYDLSDVSKHSEILNYALRELCLDLANHCAEAMQA